MSRDHGLALWDYLVVYGKVSGPSIQPGTITMTDVDLDSFTLCYYTSSPQKLTIKWDDARENENIKVTETSDIKPKLVSMAKFAAAEQGYAHKQIKKVLGPTRASYPMYLYFVLGVWASFGPSSFQAFASKDLILSRIGAALPAKFRGFLGRKIRGIVIATYVIHLLEIAVFSIPLFRKYRVPLKQRVQWTLMHFIEGFPVPLRLKKLAEEA